MSFLIVPQVGSGASRNDPFVPKYVIGLGVPWTAIDLPRHWCIVHAQTTPGQDQTVGANPDAIVVADLDATIALDGMKAALEAMLVPAHWLAPSMTYRTVLRAIAGLAAIAQRCHGLGFTLDLKAGKLNAPIGAIVKAVFVEAANSLGIDASAITEDTTLRHSLAVLGHQFAQGRGITLGDL